MKKLFIICLLSLSLVACSGSGSSSSSSPSVEGFSSKLNDNPEISSVLFIKRTDATTVVPGEIGKYKIDSIMVNPSKADDTVCSADALEKDAQTINKFSSTFIKETVALLSEIDESTEVSGNSDDKTSLVIAFEVKEGTKIDNLYVYDNGLVNVKFNDERYSYTIDEELVKEFTSKVDTFYTNYYSNTYCWSAK